MFSWRRVLPGVSSNVALTEEFPIFDSSFFWWMLFILWLMAMGIGQAVQGVVKVTKKVVERETAQEVGKSVLERWLDSVFKS